MYKHLIIDQEHNRLLCNPSLVGTGEVVEIFSLDESTDSFLSGSQMIKIKDPNEFQVCDSTRISIIGDKCVLRVLYRNRSGVRKRRFCQDEKVIVNLEKGPTSKDVKVHKAKTGSVRTKKKRRKNAKR
jgi:hypothetical protein